MGGVPYTSPDLTVVDDGRHHGSWPLPLRSTIDSISSQFGHKSITKIDFLPISLEKMLLLLLLLLSVGPFVVSK